MRSARAARASLLRFGPRHRQLQPLASAPRHKWRAYCVRRRAWTAGLVVAAPRQPAAPPARLTARRGRRSCERLGGLARFFPTCFLLPRSNPLSLSRAFAAARGALVVRRAAGGAGHPSSPARGSVSRSSAARGARGSCAALRRRSALPGPLAVWRPSAPRRGTTPTALARGPRAPLPAWHATIMPPRRGRRRCVRRSGARGVALQRFGLAQRFDALAPRRPARSPRRRSCWRRWRCWRRRAPRTPLRRPATCASLATHGAASTSPRQPQR